MTTTVAPVQSEAMSSPFVRCLIDLIRAEDSFGAWEKRSDEWLLREYLLSPEERRQIPIIGDPDPDTLARVESFYKAVGLTIEKRTGMMASPMMKMSHEGFGRVVLIVGRLVVYSKSLRDVHRFGYRDLDALAEAGLQAVMQAESIIDTFPEAAKG